MPAEATWFGPADRPLAGWLHVPDGGRARGAVVLCPPVGLEYVTSHRAMRLAAELLAGRGFVALRFDYDGTGDSVGAPDEPGRVEALLASVTAAVEEVRAAAAGAPVALAGLRMGAALAATWSAGNDASGDPLAALVLWDAPRSGRAFVRQQRSLGLLVGGRDLGDGAVDAPGFHLSADTAADLRRIDPATLPPPRVPRVLVLSRPGEQASAWPPAGSGVTHDVVLGMPEMLDVPSPHLLVATAAVERVVGWLDDVLPADPVDVAARTTTEAVVADGVVERHVRVGPLGLPGVETAPVSAPPAERAVLLLNNAAENHIGPVRLWTELARDWAGRGIRSVRFDLPGVGDSATRPGEPEDLIYTAYERQDVLDVVASGVAGDAPVVVGLCSGAHLALRVGSALPASSVVAVNIATTLPIAPRPVGPGFDLELPRGWPRRVLRAVGVGAAGRTVMRRLEAATTGSARRWWRLLVAAGVVVSPGRGLLALAGRDVTLVCGPEDAAGYLTRGRHDLERARAGGLEFVAVDDLDHVPMPVRQRQALKALLTDQVLRRVAPAVPATGR